MGSDVVQGAQILLETSFPKVSSSVRSRTSWLCRAASDGLVASVGLGCQVLWLRLGLFGARMWSVSDSGIRPQGLHAFWSDSEYSALTGSKLPDNHAGFTQVSGNSAWNPILNKLRPEMLKWAIERLPCPRRIL